MRIDPDDFRCNFRGHFAYNVNLASTPTVELFWENGDPIASADVDFRETAGDAKYIRWRFNDSVARRPGLPLHFRIIAKANGVVLKDSLESLEVTRIDEAD